MSSASFEAQETQLEQYGHVNLLQEGTKVNVLERKNKIELLNFGSGIRNHFSIQYNREPSAQLTSDIVPPEPLLGRILSENLLGAEKRLVLWASVWTILDDFLWSDGFGYKQFLNYLKGRLTDPGTGSQNYMSYRFWTLTTIRLIILATRL